MLEARVQGCGKFGHISIGIDPHCDRVIASSQCSSDIAVCKVVVVGITRSRVEVTRQAIATALWEANRTTRVSQVVASVAVCIFLIIEVSIERIVD